MKPGREDETYAASFLEEHLGRLARGTAAVLSLDYVRTQFVRREEIYEPGNPKGGG